MLFAFNMLMIGLVALIAYWWGNQGFFSALLHLVCVIVAGGVALAFWEPAANMLLGIDNKILQGFAYSISLLLIFAITLFVLRLGMDRIAPGNVNMPQWVNYVFGGACGFGAGTIVMGILFLGLSFSQSGNSIMGYRGVQRTGQKIERISSTWYPAHAYTVKFYDYLSVTSLSSSTPLRQYNPNLATQASLFRDSSGKGKGMMTQPHDAATIDSINSFGDDRLFIRVLFNKLAVDYGERMTITQSQVRLIEAVASGSAGEPRTLAPKAWHQPHSEYHIFDSTTQAVSNEPGKESVAIRFEFILPAGFKLSDGRRSAFLQIRNQRYPLTGEVTPASEMVGVTMSPGTPDAPINPTEDITRFAENSPRLRVNESSNTLDGGLVLQKPDNVWIVSGEETLETGGLPVGSSIRLKGIYAPAGTAIVRIDVSRNAVNYMAVENMVDADALIELFDDRGDSYTPIGYLLSSGGKLKVKLDPTRRVSRIEQIPKLGRDSTDKLELVFRVTSGAKLTGLQIGGISLGTLNMTAKEDL